MNGKTAKKILKSVAVLLGTLALSVVVYLAVFSVCVVEVVAEARSPISQRGAELRIEECRNQLGTRLRLYVSVSDDDRKREVLTLAHDPPAFGYSLSWPDERSIEIYFPENVHLLDVDNRFAGVRVSFNQSENDMK